MKTTFVFPFSSAEKGLKIKRVKCIYAAQRIMLQVRYTALRRKWNSTGVSTYKAVSQSVSKMSNDVKEQLDCSSFLERADATWVFYKTPQSSFSFLMPTHSHDWCHWLQSVRRRYKWTFMMHVFVCSSKLSHRHSATVGHSHRTMVICVINKTAEK